MSDTSQQTLWQLYQDTVFLVNQKLSGDPSFAIVTAFNPNGQVLDEVSNFQLDAQLEADINELKVPYRSMWGGSPDFSHKEHSWAIYTDKKQALQIAEKYSQNAIFWVEKDLLYLEPCQMQGVESSCLGPFSTRQVLDL